MPSISGRMLLDIRENLDSNWLSQGKHIASRNGKARERQASGWPAVLSVSVLCCPQQHWLHPRTGPSLGGGVLREEVKKRDRGRETPLL